MSVELEAYVRQLAEEAYAENRHIPASWEVSYDDGADGCIPAGWYLQGLAANGFTVDFPIRHEYGPFKSEAAANRYKEKVIKELWKIK